MRAVPHPEAQCQSTGPAGRRHGPRRRRQRTRSTRRSARRWLASTLTRRCAPLLSLSNPCPATHPLQSVLHLWLTAHSLRRAAHRCPFLPGLRDHWLPALNPGCNPELCSMLLPPRHAPAPRPLRASLKPRWSMGRTVSGRPDAQACLSAVPSQLHTCPGACR